MPQRHQLDSFLIKHRLVPDKKLSLTNHSVKNQQSSIDDCKYEQIIHTRSIIGMELMPNNCNILSNMKRIAQDKKSILQI